MTISLHDSQKAEAFDIRRRLLAYGEVVVPELPTGRGRTISVLTAAMHAATTGRILYVSHREELIDQTKNIAARMGIEIDTRLYRKNYVWDDQPGDVSIICESLRNLKSRVFNSRVVYL